jgi:hypothetical protein
MLRRRWQFAGRVLSFMAAFDRELCAPAWFAGRSFVTLLQRFGFSHRDSEMMELWPVQ